MWSWNPAINRLVKLPPSMMSQGWMGSDYTNDDILRESSVVDDYNHSMEGTEIIDGHECWKIKLLAKEDADVLWGHQVWWIDRNEYIALKAELYDEDGYLVRSEKASELKMMDGRLIPTVLELVPAENEGYKTIVKIIEIKFNIKIEESFFSQQNMKTNKVNQNMKDYQLAWKNLWRNKRRTLITAASVFFAVFFALSCGLSSLEPMTGFSKT